MNLSGIKKFFPFIKDVFSEGGSGSFSRVAAGSMVISTLFWITYLVVKNHALPDLAGPTLFVSGGSGATYGANKVASVFKKDPGPPPPSA